MPRDRPVTGPPTAIGGAWVTLRCAAPPPGRRLRRRAARPGAVAPIDRRQFLQLSALGAAGLRRAAAWASRSPKQRVPARAQPRDPAARRSSTTTLPSGVIVPTAPWLIAENAKPGTLDWICNHVQPDHALEGFASQVSAVPGRRRRALRQHHGHGRAGPGLPHGLLPGSRRPARLADRLRGGHGPTGRRWCRPASARSAARGRQP